ncbi:MAG: hypothetical protein HZC37_27460 [Burkholderiales bacterium]|nr:hypothetical protein [Burkholderiales bacterium]
MSLVDTLLVGLRTAGELAVAYSRHADVAQLLSYDRQTGMNLIAQLVQSQPAQVLDQWENDFLEIASTSIMDPAQRRRAMELYAWLKMAESHRYGQFRGFIGNG